MTQTRAAGYQVYLLDIDGRSGDTAAVAAAAPCLAVPHAEVHLVAPRSVKSPSANWLLLGSPQAPASDGRVLVAGGKGCAHPRSRIRGAPCRARHACGAQCRSGRVLGRAPVAHLADRAAAACAHAVVAAPSVSRLSRSVPSIPELT